MDNWISCDIRNEDSGGRGDEKGDNTQLPKCVEINPWLG